MLRANVREMLSNACEMLSNACEMLSNLREMLSNVYEMLSNLREMLSNVAAARTSGGFLASSFSSFSTVVHSVYHTATGGPVGETCLPPADCPVPRAGPPRQRRGWGGALPPAPPGGGVCLSLRIAPGRPGA